MYVHVLCFPSFSSHDVYFRQCASEVYTCSVSCIVESNVPGCTLFVGAVVTFQNMLSSPEGPKVL